MRIKLIIFLTFLISMGCSNKNSGEVFTKLSSGQTGIEFTNTLEETDNLNILDYLYFYNGGGIAIGDINNDGLPDIYLSANQTDNKLYLNKGGMTFEDITDKAGVAGKSSWNTGAVMGDVNGDGLLDIYVCAVVGLNGFNGHNELFINQGNGIFEEKSAEYGLDFESYSSNAAFLDYDLDGDLDIYLLNHAVHSQDTFGNVKLRYQRSYETGDKLLRNDNGHFTDVSEEAGIFGGINGYGLGVAVSDFNLDGYPDLYIGNDFHEDDYYYLNNGDGTFSDKLRDSFGHTSRFSMGSDVADINHDGRPDLISLDMLPENEKVLKSSEGDDNIQVQKLRINEYGYHYQFTRNMLYINQPDGTFMETALASGIAATDWSWSALFGDYDQDGEQDIFISNGIPKRPNDLDYINFLSNDNVEKKINNTNLIDKKALDLMPSGYVENKIFQGTGEYTFIDKSKKWIPQDTLVAGATAYGDLDNDGDLDLVTNNLNSSISFYENLTNEKSNYLKVSLSYKKGNKLGIGTKVISYSQGKTQFRELYTVRGFQSSSQPIIHFGYGKITSIDSLKILWPDRSYQIIKNVALNQTLEISPQNTIPYKEINNALKDKLFAAVENNLGIDFTHKEDSYTDFNRQKLIPYQASDRGPAMSVGDINNDGRDDIYFGGSKFFPSQIYIQKDSNFVKTLYPNIQKDSIKEDVVSLFLDSEKEGVKRLLVGTGGADFFGQAKALTSSYYEFENLEGKAKALGFPELFENTSVVIPIDIDNDGDLDLFMGSQSVSGDFGQPTDSHLFINNNGVYTEKETEALKALGMVTDAIAEDFNNDGKTDLIIVGEWMAPKFLKNDEGNLVLDEKLTDENLNGLWQSIQSFDIDHDGDNDYLLGNWGTNSKFSASAEHPMKMYYNDFDKNGNTETIVCTFNQDGYYPINGLNELSSQLVFLRKKFNSYTSFAGKPIEEIIDKKLLSDSKVLWVDNLSSGYLENDKGTFRFVPFPFELQLAPIMDFLKFDFYGDGKDEVLAGGNYFGVKPYHGRFDSFPGALIKTSDEIILGNELGLHFSFKSLRHLSIVNYQGNPYLLATFNNEKAQLYKIKR